MASTTSPLETKEPLQLLTISLNTVQFTIPKHLAPKDSILDTEEAHIDLTFILPIYAGPLLPELFSAYLDWLQTHNVTQLIVDNSSAIRITKATILLQIGAALGDEGFRVAITKYMECLYGEYDAEFGPVSKPRREW